MKVSQDYFEVINGLKLEVENNYTAALAEFEEYTALYEAAIASTYDNSDDKDLAARKYGDNPPTNELIQDYKTIDRQGFISYETTPEDDLKIAK